MDVQFMPMGDQAVIIILGEAPNDNTLNKVQFLTSYLEKHPFDWMIEYIPAFTSIAIIYDPMKIITASAKNVLSPFEYIREQFIPVLSQNMYNLKFERRIIEIPVCYGGSYGPDLKFIATANGLTPDEVIKIHSTGDYSVQMIGFAPGFPYINGMSEKIAAPRKDTPRLKIPAQSVGIGGKQTGIYPIETPGGWQIIGRTPLNLFRPKCSPPSLLRAGDKIQFIPINEEEFKVWRRQQHD